MTTTESGSGRRPPGRPRKYGQGRINATVRFTPERYAALKAEADKQGRSVSEEVEVRVGRSFTDDVLTGIQRGLNEVTAEMSEIGQELLNKALAQIDELRARNRELETRVTELLQEQALTEERLTQIVENAVARALGGNK
jgi:hypothetical protein